MISENLNLPWVEKYRPNTLQDLISHKDIIRTITKFIDENQLPHLLFYGPPGTGKTSAILAYARKLYQPKQFRSMVLELNASDDRGINIVRGPIFNFASTRAIFKSGFKLIILDEADAMTNDAQNALRRIIEKFTENVRFCLICNYLSKIIPALQSRCTRFRFGPLSPDQIIPRLNHVIEQEKLEVTEDGKQALIDLSQGDMRKVLNILQSSSIAFTNINEEAVYTCVGHPLKKDITNILKWLLNDDFLSTYNRIQNLKVEKGLALQDILTEVHTFLHEIELPSETLVELLIKLSDIEYRLSRGTNEYFQLSSLIAAFHIARDKIKVDDKKVIHSKSIRTMAAPASVPDEPEKVTVFGIDLGTLQSRAVIIKEDEDGLRKSILVADIPSVVTFTNNDPSECIVGSAAKIRIIASASNTFCDTKLLIGRDYEDPVVKEVAENKAGYKILKSCDGNPCVSSSNINQVFTPSHIAALILLKLKEYADDEVKISMKNVVITTPAYFTEPQVQATREAARMAGLNVLKIIDEPTAVVLAYDSNQTDKTVVVYDFGGTFKVSVVEIRNGEPKVKSTAYDLFLGGDDFDEVLINYFVDELKRLTKVDCRTDRNRMQWLRKAAEHAKIDLSAFTEIKINFYIIGFKKQHQRITLELKRSKFEEMVEKFINKTKPLCQKALDDAKVSVSDIEEVFAVGGISMIPKVKVIVEEFFAKAPRPNEKHNKKELVAFGAAVIGHTLAVNLTEDIHSSRNILSHLPSPVKQTDAFFYKTVDVDSSDGIRNYASLMFSTGIVGIFTEEEAEKMIMMRKKPNNLKKCMDNGMVVLCLQKLVQIRRRDTETPMSEEKIRMLTSFRRRIDGVILNELREIYRSMPGGPDFIF